VVVGPHLLVAMIASSTNLHILTMTHNSIYFQKLREIVLFSPLFSWNRHLLLTFRPQSETFLMQSHTELVTDVLKTSFWLLSILFNHVPMRATDLSFFLSFCRL